MNTANADTFWPTGHTSRPIDSRMLAAYLRAELHISGEIDHIAEFSGGHANLTFLIALGNREFVLRLPPAGTLAPGAHDMRREFSALSGLFGIYDRVPQPLLFCADATLLGSPFLIVERIRGVIVRDSLPHHWLSMPNIRRRISDALVDALADLHGIDAAQSALEGLGRPDGFLERQLTGWHRRWTSIAASYCPLFDNVHDWLAVKSRPISTPPTKSSSALILLRKMEIHRVEFRVQP